MSEESTESEAPATTHEHLQADCSRCAGLCCVVPAFTASADFAIDKPAEQPCRNLLADFRCDIHDSLRERGFAGCAVFDCFGAGQQITQVTFGGRDWRGTPAIASSMFKSFTVMRQLRELLWYLIEGVDLVSTGSLREQLDSARRQTEELTRASPGELADFDAGSYRQGVGTLLARVSQEVRTETHGSAPDRSNADLIGAKLRGADLRGTCLRGAYLIGADLRKADLRAADLLGADLRAADLRGARLEGSIFLTRPQLEAARGDHTTRIPPAFDRPPHWSTRTAGHRRARPGRERG